MQGANNELRQQAEAQLKTMRAAQAKALFSSICEVIQSGDVTVKPLACVLLKKFYLDGRAEEAELEQITLDEVRALKQMLKDTLDIANEPFNILRRKAEIICKCHKQEESYGELVVQMSALAGQAASSDDSVNKGKRFAMYMFELLSEYHLPQEQIV